MKIIKKIEINGEINKLIHTLTILNIYEHKY